MILTRILLLGLILTTGACSLFGSGTAPNDMSVEDHHQRSQEHAVEARAHRARYDAQVQIVAERDDRSQQGRWARDYDYREIGDDYGSAGSYNPSQRHLTHTREHEEIAKKHREAAQALERFEEAQCASFPPGTRATCPLLGHLVSAENIPNGIRIRFADDVDLNVAMARMRCHIAFARSRAKAGMDDCPLYLDGIHVLRVEPGSAVDLVTNESTRVDNLRHRVKRRLAREAQ